VNLSFLKQNFSGYIMTVFHNNFNGIFLRPQNNAFNLEIYDPIKFIDILIQHVKSDKINIKANPYWAVVFYYCLKHKKLSSDTKLILIKNINKCLSLLKLKAK
jgi:hypothetical protein